MAVKEQKDKRDFQRNHYQVPIMYSKHMMKGYTKAEMCNCSLGGVGFISDEPFMPGSHLYLKPQQLTTGNYNEKYEPGYLSEVQWCMEQVGLPEEKPFYIVGAQFTEPLSHLF